jgi:hypothetical protein
MEGKRLALILIASNPDEGGGVLRGPVRRVENGFAIERRTGPAFPLVPEWASRTRSLQDLEDADVRAIIGDADYFLTLSVGDLKSEAEKEDLQPTGLNWNEFTGEGSE